MKVIGVVFAVAGAIAAVYVGAWLLFVGGVVEIIDAAKSNPTDRELVGWGLLQMLVLAPASTFAIWKAASWLCDACFELSDPLRRTSSGNRAGELGWEKLQHEWRSNG